MFAVALIATLQMPSFLGSEKALTRQHRMLGHWTLEISDNRFLGERSCRLSTQDIQVERAIIIFRFPKNIDTSDAWYRVDYGPPKAWRWLQPQILTSGAVVRSADLENPSEGRVPIPVKELEAASQISIAPSANAKPKTFKLYGLEIAMDRARALGCTMGNAK